MLSETYINLIPDSGAAIHPSYLDLIASMGNLYAKKNAPCKKLRRLYVSILRWPGMNGGIQTYAIFEGSNWKWLIRHAGRAMAAFMVLGAVGAEIKAQNKQQKYLTQAKTLYGHIFTQISSTLDLKQIDFGPVWPELSKITRIENNRSSYSSRKNRFGTLAHVFESLQDIIHLVQPGNFPTDRVPVSVEWLTTYILRNMIFTCQDPDLILTGAYEYAIAKTLGHQNLLKAV